MQIKTRTFNALSVVVGLILTAAVWQHMASNPRWAGDNGPGVGKLPRGIVQGFLHEFYDEGKGNEAIKRYMTDNWVDAAVPVDGENAGAPIKHIVRRVVAEGLNVVVWHCIDGTNGGQSAETVDIFRAVNGRIVERIRPAAQRITTRCDQASWPAPHK